MEENTRSGFDYLGEILIASSWPIGVIVGIYVMLKIWSTEYVHYIFVAFLAWPISLIIVAFVATVVTATIVVVGMLLAGLAGGVYFFVGWVHSFIRKLRGQKS